MEEIIKKGPVPALPEDILIQYANDSSCIEERPEIPDLSENGVREIVEKVRNGTYWSLFLCPDEEGEEGYLMMESSPDLLFLQIWDAEAETAWSCFDPAFLDSKEEAPIEPSDGQSVIDMRNTMENTAENRDLAAKCIEWYIHTLQPYPGMDWLKMAW